MEFTQGVWMPMHPNVLLDLAENRGEKELHDLIDYQEVVGSLMCAALGTRPDFPYAVAALSHYNSYPFTSHMTAAKRVLQYLKSTADFRLHFNHKGIDIRNGLVGYSDSNWANDSTDRHSHGGHVFLTSNSAISSQSQMQGFIAMSTLEAEFIACSAACREPKWLLQLLNDIHDKDSPPLPINCNNQGALTLIITGIIEARTKHIDVCDHNSPDLHTRPIVYYSYEHTDENVADILTKALTKHKHTMFTKPMGVW